jgi:hypothetical protein
METFLNIVAKDIYTKIGNDLSKVAIVFPNKRASLFFNEFLADQSENPIWSPAYLSISELFQQLSAFTPSAFITAVSRLPILSVLSVEIISASDRILSGSEDFPAFFRITMNPAC